MKVGSRDFDAWVPGDYTAHPRADLDFLTMMNNNGYFTFRGDKESKVDGLFGARHLSRQVIVIFRSTRGWEVDFTEDGVAVASKYIRNMPQLSEISRLWLAGSSTTDEGKSALESLE